MKKIVLIVMLFTKSILANDITVEVSELINEKGKLSIGLYNQNDDTFADMTKHYKGVHLIIDKMKIVYTFQDVPNGTYAISIFHDENENEILDKNFFGMPKEGYGFSNNIRPTFRGATFEESKFDVKNSQIIKIIIGY
ncbi:MAG: DUF2141 domain-containing protein [Sulfurospirillum sp.]|nr:DUF2141 domain-containing protein [Sulfurospirillum sp.]